MSRFQFVADHLDTYPVKWLCAIVEIARSSFYAWFAGADGRAAREAADQALAERIRIVHEADNTYGRRGSPLNSTTCARAGAGQPQTGGTGDAGGQDRRLPTPPPGQDHNTGSANQKVPDLLNRDFTAAAANEKYVGDITYLPLATGSNLYLATVIDCFSGRVAGWAIASTCALNSSKMPSSPPRRCVVHWRVLCSMPITEVSTPQRDFATLCADLGVVQSMGGVGSSADNALAESFNATPQTRDPARPQPVGRCCYLPPRSVPLARPLQPQTETLPAAAIPARPATKTPTFATLPTAA